MKLNSIDKILTVATCSILLNFSFIPDTNAVSFIKKPDSQSDDLLPAGNTQRSQPRAITATILTRGEIGKTVFKLVSGNTYQATDFDSLGNISRTRQVYVRWNGNFIEMKSLDATQDTYRGIVSGNRIDNGIWFNPNDSVWFGTWTATLE